MVSYLFVTAHYSGSAADRAERLCLSDCYSNLNEAMPLGRGIASLMMMRSTESHRLSARSAAEPQEVFSPTCGLYDGGFASLMIAKAAP